MRRSQSSKGQFFFISLMLIITFLSGLQALFAGFSDIDLSEPYGRQEDFWFWNIKDQLNRTFDERKCPQLAVDYQEIKIMTESYLARRGVEFRLVNTTPICPAQTVRIEMNMTSTRINLFDNFTLVSQS
ncbi:MAG: hypothetical protein JSV92_04240 [archaeon]|nr:MAG: hypothetical protein JSV92_04240 [archaeon]